MSALWLNLFAVGLNAGLLFTYGGDLLPVCLPVIIINAFMAGLCAP